MATPREASATRPIGLYGLTGDNRLVYRDPAKAPWTAPSARDPPAGWGWPWWTATCGPSPPTAACGASLAETSEWTRVDDSAGAIALTALNARLHIVDPNGRIRTRMPLPTPSEWTDLCTADCTVLTAPRPAADRHHPRPSPPLENPLCPTSKRRRPVWQARTGRPRR